MRIDAGVLAKTTLGDEVVVLHIPSSRYMKLNGAAGSLLELLETEQDEQSLATHLTAQFGIPPSQAAAEVQAFVVQLADAGLLA